MAVSAMSISRYWNAFPAVQRFEARQHLFENAPSSTGHFARSHLLTPRPASRLRAATRPTKAHRHAHELGRGGWGNTCPPCGVSAGAGSVGLDRGRNVRIYGRWYLWTSSFKCLSAVIHFSLLDD